MIGKTNILEMLSESFLLTFMLAAAVTPDVATAGVLLPTKLWEIITGFATDLGGNIFCLKNYEKYILSEKNCFFFRQSNIATDLKGNIFCVLRAKCIFLYCEYRGFHICDFYTHMKFLRHLRPMKRSNEQPPLIYLSIPLNSKCWWGLFKSYIYYCWFVLNWHDR